MLGTDLDADGYLKRLKAELDRLDRRELIQLADWIYDAWETGKAVFIFGNGGSAASATHLAEDLGKGSLTNEELRSGQVKRLRVLSLTDNVGWITAVANDLSYEQIFVQQLANYAQAGDLAVGISVSGNSANVVKAIEWANHCGLRTFGLTGYDGGRLKQIQQAGLHVPLDDMGMVEGIHNCVLHWVTDDLFARIHRSGRYAKSS